MPDRNILLLLLYVKDGPTNPGWKVPRATKFERWRRDVSRLHICQSSVGRYRASCRPIIATVCMFVHNEMVALGNCSAGHTRLKSICIWSLSIRRQLSIDGQCVIGMLPGVTAVDRQQNELWGVSRIEVGRTDGLMDHRCKRVAFVPYWW